MEKKRRKVVVGENSNAEYEILNPIEQGAQGKVYAIRGNKYTLKLLGKKNSKKAIRLKSKIAYIKTRPIKDLPISKPLEMIKGKHLGYIMEMAEGMESLEKLLIPDGSANWWQNTGGLKKRIEILIKLSKVLAELHSRGLIYGDLSPKNVFVSASKDYSEIFLIDCDNITHESKVGQAVYTPGYGAPEVIRQESGADTYTDNYAFAILAYQLLTLNHPFVGDYVNNGEPELEEKAYLGEIPWINHQDKINKSSSGIKISKVLSRRLLDAFRATFEDGVKNKIKRITALKWNKLLSTFRNMMLKCETCNHYFFVDIKKSCPFCKSRSGEFYLLKVFPFIKSLKEDFITDNILRQTSLKPFTGSVLYQKILPKEKYVNITKNDFLLKNSDEVLFKIKIDSINTYIRVDEPNNIIFHSVKNNNYVNKSIEKGLKIPNNKVGDYLMLIGDEIGDYLMLIGDEINGYQRAIQIKKKG